MRVFIYIQIHISLRKIFIFCFKTSLQSVELWAVMGPCTQHGASSGITWGLEGGGSGSFIIITFSLFLKTPFIENTPAQIINLCVVSTITEATENVKQKGRVSDHRLVWRVSGAQPGTASLSHGAGRTCTRMGCLVFLVFPGSLSLHNCSRFPTAAF